VFVSNPRGWAQAKGDPGQDDAFVSGCADAKLPVFVHAPYLVNFGSPTAATLDGSVAAVQHSLERGRALCARGVVVHAGRRSPAAGTTTRCGRCANGCARCSDELTDDSPDLLIELTAGGAARSPARRTSCRRTWTPWTGTPRSASASTPATPWRQGTIWPPRAGCGGC
jgi:deoxyribonuclease-4